MEAVITLLGLVSITLASVLQTYCEFGRQVRPEFRPGLFATKWSYLLEAGWVVLLLLGGVLLFITSPIVCAAGVVAFWLLLPISIGSRVRRRFLPSWDELKHELEREGYNERNYWRGNWWRADAPRRRRSKPGS